MIEEQVTNAVNKLLTNEKLSRKAIYEHLLTQQLVKPNSENIVYQLLDKAIEKGEIKDNKIYKYRKKRGKLPEIFTSEQLTKIFDEIDRPKLAICVWLGFFCGLRIREVCNLQVEDLNLQTKKLFVRNSKNTNRSRDGYGKDRIVSIPELAISPISKWLDIIQGGKWFLPSMQDPNKPIRTKTIHEQYRQLLSKAGLSGEDYTTQYRAKNHGKRKDLRKTTYKYRFHTLRHTYATYLLSKDVPLENIQRSLGHNQIDTTLIYARVQDSRTSELINDAFSTPVFVSKSETLSKVITPQVQSKSAQDILKQRLAKGEIDLLTYRRLLAEISPENTVNVVIDSKAMQH